MISIAFSLNGNDYVVFFCRIKRETQLRTTFVPANAVVSFKSIYAIGRVQLQDVITMERLFHFTGRNWLTGELFRTVLSVQAITATSATAVTATLLAFAGGHTTSCLETDRVIFVTRAKSSTAIWLTATVILAIGGAASILVATLAVRARAVFWTVGAILKLIRIALPIITVE